LQRAEDLKLHRRLPNTDDTRSSSATAPPSARCWRPDPLCPGLQQRSGAYQQVAPEQLSGGFLLMFVSVSVTGLLVNRPPPWRTMLWLLPTRTLAVTVVSFAVSCPENGGPGYVPTQTPPPCSSPTGAVAVSVLLFTVSSCSPTVPATTMPPPRIVAET